MTTTLINKTIQTTFRVSMLALLLGFGFVLLPHLDQDLADHGVCLRHLVVVVRRIGR